MSKIVVFGARGKLGPLIVEEALQRGHEVTAVTRDGTGLEPAENRVASCGCSTLVANPLWTVAAQGRCGRSRR